MGLATILASFAVCFFTNVFLNSFDVYSDIALAINTLTFNVGESLLLRGCKVCYRKDEDEVFSLKNRSCQQCLTRNNMFQCGNSIEFLKKMSELEHSEICTNERFGLAYNDTTNVIDWKDGTCNGTMSAFDSVQNIDFCCVENSQKQKKISTLDSMDKRITAYQLKSFRQLTKSWLKHFGIRVTLFMLGGSLSNYQCQVNHANQLAAPENQAFYQYLVRLVKSLQRGSLHKKELLFKLKKSVNGRTHLEEGFDHTNECGLYITFDQESQVQNNGETCNGNACLYHLQNLKYYFNISSLEDWKQKTIYHSGVKYGGKTCRLLWIYGIASLVPILINIVFTLQVYLEDVKIGKATKVESALVLLACYPQFKCLKFAIRFLFHKDVKKFDQENNEHYDRLGSLEPFLEAAFQVSI